MPHATPAEDLPPEITGPAAWYGPDMAADGAWVRPLTAAEVAEVERAVAAGTCCGSGSRPDCARCRPSSRNVSARSRRGSAAASSCRAPC